jgi:hypothetical protein
MKQGCPLNPALFGMFIKHLWITSMSTTVGLGVCIGSRNVPELLPVYPMLPATNPARMQFLLDRLAEYC